MSFLIRRLNKSALRHYSSTPSTAEQKPLTGYRKYAQQFKSKPGSYMATFAVLHEVTAIVPFPIVYLILENSEVKIPFPENVITEGNRFINRARVYYGYEPLEADNRTMVNLVTTYGIVKVSFSVTLFIIRSGIFFKNKKQMFSFLFFLGHAALTYCCLCCHDTFLCGKTCQPHCNCNKTWNKKVKYGPIKTW
jgi:hypothetical protein